MQRENGAWRAVGAQIFGTFAPLVIIAAAVIQYVGAGFAINLFGKVSPEAVIWGRITFAAVFLLLMIRPRWQELHGKWKLAILFGIVLTGMNFAFYKALAYIPLGTAVALEFLGPVVLAGLTGRGWRVRLALAISVCGVFLISWAGIDLQNREVQLGVFWILLAALCWAFYIILGRKAAHLGMGQSVLAVGMAAGALLFTPFTFGAALGAVTNLYYLGLLLLIAFMASVIPYAAEMAVMKHLKTEVFSLLNSLYPATSLLVGMFMLRQIPSWGEVAGLVAITCAVVLVSVGEKYTTSSER